MAGEYRIIPLEKPESSSEKDAVNIPELLRAINNRRSFIIKITTFCLILGLLYALFSPVEYKSESKVLPEIGDAQQSALGDLFKNYGGLLGLDNVGSLNSSNNKSISPQIYPEIVHSLNFQYAMLWNRVYFADIDSSLTIFQYFKPRVGHFYERWLDNENYEGTLKSLPDSVRQQIDAKQISSVSLKELEVINEMRERITIDFDSETGVMEVTARMPDAFAAAQVCKSTINRLTKYVKEYRTQKAQNVLDFSEEQFRIGQKKFQKAQNELADFEDQNVNLSSAKAQSHQEYLESEYDLAYNVYNSVAQKRIQARMNLQKNTPIFKILQSADIPLDQYKPRWIPIIIFSLGGGFVISFLLIAGQIIIENLQQKL